MSTRVQREEWPQLTMVPVENWTHSPWNNPVGMPCDIDPTHDRAGAFMQTSDHRAIALCRVCYQRVQAAKVRH